MTQHDDFGPGIPLGEHAELERLALRLAANRPIPRPAFRGDLRRRIAAPQRVRARALRARAVSCLTGGCALLLVAVMGVNDVGPLAPQAPDRPELRAAIR